MNIFPHLHILLIYQDIHYMWKSFGKKWKHSLGKSPAPPCMLSGRVLAWPLPGHLPPKITGCKEGTTLRIGHIHRKPQVNVIPFRELTCPPWEKENHLQKWFLMGYVNSQEGTSWWLNRQIWKICDRHIGSWNPNFRGEHKKLFETTTQDKSWIYPPMPPSMLSITTRIVTFSGESLFF